MRVVPVLLLIGIPAALASHRGGMPDFWQVADRLARDAGAGENLDQVLEHMMSLEERWKAVPHRLRPVLRGLAEPWTPPATARELRDALQQPLAGGHASFTKLADVAARWLELGALPSATGARPDADLAGLEAIWADLQDPGLEGTALLQRLSAFMAAAHQALQRAHGELTPEQRLLLYQQHAGFCEAWYRSHFPGVNPTAEQEQLIRDWKRQLLAEPPVDRRKVLAVAAILLRLADGAFLATLDRRLESVPKDPAPPAGFSGDIVAVAGDTPASRVVLGGPRRSRYDAPAALVLDPGGADVYTVAAAAGGEVLASVVLDLKGADRYECEGPGPAWTTGGVAILLDRTGGDHYQSARLGQAAAALGFALLADLHGDDDYRLEDYGQGHALGGAAFLYDAEGNDSYEAWAYAQGSDLGPGLGVLADGGGRDSYLADGRWPDVYGDSGPEIYHGAAQGYATGLRPEVPGGIAALLDLGRGEDRYQAGNFSQGGGYYFSFGLMYDGGGDDENHGSRYAQGFGVHQAVGVRWDAGGDDEYLCRSVAHLGMGWDEGVGYLIEDEGNDEYDAGGLAVGGAAQTAVAVFLDREGRDRYRTRGTTDSQGGTGGSEYHGKPALGICFDLGGDQDDWGRPDNGDRSVRADEGVAVFADAREQSFARLLRRLERAGGGP